MNLKLLTFFVIGNIFRLYSGNVYPFDGLDTLSARLDKVYSYGVSPHWLGTSNIFWYKNHEKTRDVYYLVDATTGEKRSGATYEAIMDLLPEKDKSLLKASDNNVSSSSDKSISPDKKWKYLVLDNNVYLQSLTDIKSKPVQLSFDGAPGYYYHQLAWSPDSRKLSALKTREADVRRIPLLESSPDNQLQPLLHWRNYAKPGDVLPVSVPALFDVDNLKQIELDTKYYENQFSLNFTGWRSDSRSFSFEFNERGHQRYVVGEVDALTGKITKVIDETSSTFIDYTRRFRYDLYDGRKIIWLSERDGWKQLYLFDTEKCEVNRITKGSWVVRSVVRVDESEGTIYFMASGFNRNEDPYNLHYCKISIDGKGFTDLTPENGNHVISLSSDNSRFVDVYSRPDKPSVSVLRDGMNGNIISVLEKCDISELEKTGWVIPEVFCSKGRDGKTDIWGTIYRPSNFDPTKTYPVIEDIYAGPHDSFVNKNFSAYDRYISPLVELGFIVVKIDGMGTNNRSKKFHDVCWKNLRDSGFPDRIKWIKAAARKYPSMDISRVGIYGWSSGGQSAMGALLFFNDFYKVAVSFCGCHDNRIDKIWWNEQWMGYPVDESYSRSSNVDNAHLLKGDLFLINGELDDNVDPASTLQVVKALMKAGKNFEQLYLPGRTHSLGDKFEVYRMYDFFVRHLLNEKK